MSQIKDSEFNIVDSSRDKKYHKAILNYPKKEGWKYAGKGELTNELCGAYRESYSCECGNSQKIIKYSCNQSGCSLCYDQWAKKSASKIGIKTMAAAVHYHINNIVVPIVSLSPGKQFLVNLDWTKRRRDWSIYKVSGVELFEKEVLYPLLKKYFPGFTCIYHPDQLNKDGERNLFPHWHCPALFEKSKIPKIYSHKQIKNESNSEKKFQMCKHNAREKKKRRYCLVHLSESKIDGSIYYNTFSKLVSNIAYELGHSASCSKSMYKYIGIIRKIKIEEIRTIEKERLCSKCGGRLYYVKEIEEIEAGYNKIAYDKICEKEQKISRRKKMNSYLRTRDYELGLMEQELKEFKEKCRVVPMFKVKEFDKTTWYKDAVLSSVKISFKVNNVRYEKRLKIPERLEFWTSSNYSQLVGCYG